MTPHVSTLAKTINKSLHLDYLLYLPTAYDARQKWPLILFLHGAGERGSDVTAVSKVGLPRVVNERPDFPFIVMAPQCPSHSLWSMHVDELVALLDEVESTYAVDASRVYLTGLSMGGGGAWQLGALHPERFAAVVPICGIQHWFVADMDLVCTLKDTPVWVFHGALDNAVPLIISAELVAKLRSCGGTVRFTVYPDIGHDSWNAAYDTEALYSWLLAQRRQR